MDLIQSEENDNEPVGKIDRVGVSPNFANTILLAFIMQLIFISGVSAQDTLELPEVVMQCPNFVGGTLSSMEELGFTESLSFPTSRFIEYDDGKIYLNYAYFLEGNWDIDTSVLPEGYDVGKVMAESMPVINIFLNYAFNENDDYGINVNTEIIRATHINNNITPILVELSLGMPPEIAREALRKTADYLYNHGPSSADPILSEEVFLNYLDAENALNLFDNYLASNELNEGYDIYTLEEAATVEAVDDTNWGILTSQVNMPNSFWIFLETRGYRVKILPYTDFPEGYIGEVYGNEIRIGYDEDGNIGREILIHEIRHVIRYLMLNDLKDEFEFTLANGEVTNNIDLALAKNLQYFYENDTEEYPLFTEILNRLLIGNPISNETLQTYIQNSTGYRDLLSGNINQLNDPDAVITATREYFGREISIINEAMAVIDQRLFELCLQEENAYVPEYILDLYDNNVLEAAIQNYMGWGVEN